MSHREEERWTENHRRTFHTYNIQIEGGTLTAFYDPLESSHNLNFFPHPNGSALRESATAVYAHKRLIYSGKAKELLPEYFSKVKDLPGLPKHIAEGLEKLIEEVKTLE